MHKFNLPKISKLGYLVLILGFFLGLSSIAFFKGGYYLLSSPYQFANGEGYFLYLATQVAHGHQIYLPMTSTSYLDVPYTPVFFLITGLLVRVFGSTLLIVKIVPFIAGIGSSILIGFIVHFITKNRIVGILGSLILLSSQVLKFLSPMARVDTLALFFCLLGVYIFLRYEDSKKFLWCIPLLVLTWFTKQSYIAAPLAIGIYLFCKGRLKDTIIFSVLYGILLGGLLLIGNWITNGELVQNTLVYFGSQIGGQQIWVWSSGIYGIVYYHWTLLLLVSIYAFTWGKRLNFLIVYFLVAMILCLVTIGKPGASWHYCLESVSIASIIAGICLDKVFKVLDSKPKLGKTLLAAVPLGLLVLLSIGTPFGAGFCNYTIESNSSNEYTGIINTIKDSTTPVFSEESIFPLYANVSWEPWEPANVLTADLENKSWNDSILISRLKGSYYEYILSSIDLSQAYSTYSTSWQAYIVKQRFSLDMAKAVLLNHILVYHSGPLNSIPDGIYIYKYYGSNFSK